MLLSISRCYAGMVGKLVTGCLLLSFVGSIKVDISRHAFVDISGWPHSGTSVVHEVFKYLPEFSTFFDTCTTADRDCRRFNFEGQWLLDGYVANAYHPGVYCTLHAVKSPMYGPRLIQQWGAYWNMSRPYVVQKSPADLLKIPLLRTVFERAIDQKYIVVIKHPVTLHQALPRRISWQLLDLSDKREVHVATHTAGHLITHTLESVADHLYASLALDDLHLETAPIVSSRHRGSIGDSSNNTKAARSPSAQSCARSSGRGLGWLSAMESFKAFLEENREWAIEHVRIGISFVSRCFSWHVNITVVESVRAEDFVDNGRDICVALLEFVSSDGLSSMPSRDAIEEVCSRLFHPIEDYISRAPFAVAAQKLWKMLSPKSHELDSSHKCKDSMIWDHHTFRDLEESLLRRAASDQPATAVTAPMHMNGISRRAESAIDEATRTDAPSGSGNNSRRRLNLHQYKQNITVTMNFFDPLTIYGTCAKRALLFDSVFARFNSHNQSSLMRLEGRLRPFGYSLRRGKHYPYRCESSVFADWELMKRTERTRSEV